MATPEEKKLNKIETGEVQESASSFDSGVKSPESRKESSGERKFNAINEGLDSAIAKLNAESITQKAPHKKQTVRFKSETQKKIEDILSEDLAEAYLSMTPQQRIAFKEKGEEISNNVARMVERGRLKVKKVIQWIRDWLRMIPSVDKFFFEQETKIKVDKIVAYHEKRQNNTNL